MLQQLQHITNSEKQLMLMKFNTNIKMIKCKREWEWS